MNDVDTALEDAFPPYRLPSSPPRRPSQWAVAGPCPHASADMYRVERSWMQCALSCASERLFLERGGGPIVAPRVH